MDLGVFYVAFFHKFDSKRVIFLTFCKISVFIVYDSQLNLRPDSQKRGPFDP